ncbi:MAG: potassium/proton antiporter [candidate division Zixibacteria bacterium]|nr:potassium/proton antiporter [candidate division Zixibacteria bacterium]
MYLPLEYLLLAAALLLGAGVLATKLSSNLGVPYLVLFLLVGILAGSEGPGGIPFEDYRLARAVGNVALALILFSGGLDTRWSEVKPSFKKALSLSSLGVLVTAFAVGTFARMVLGFSNLEAILLGAIISSTDAAAVFSVLRSKKLGLKGELKPLLELESGSNDPMAVFLVIGLVELALHPEFTLWNFAVLFVQQMAVGTIIGYLLGRTLVWVVNRLSLDHEGLYPVLSLAAVFFCYSATQLFGGSGFLSVYVAGLVMASQPMAVKKTLLRFHDGLAWLAQIGMFVTLGLLIFPSQLLPVASRGFLLAAFLLLIARPAAVFVSLLFANMGWREKLFVSWVGLRGAVPIVLATYPLLAGLSGAAAIFNLIFFVVLTSALLQGSTVGLAARLLGLSRPALPSAATALELATAGDQELSVVELLVPYGSKIAGHSIVDAGFPEGTLVVLLSRNGKMNAPSGRTVLEEGDLLYLLTEQKNLPQVEAMLAPEEHGE